MNKAVPSCSVKIATKIRPSFRGTDHARTNNFSLDNEVRVSVPLTYIAKRNPRSGNLVSSFRRHHSCKVGSDFVK